MPAISPAINIGIGDYGVICLDDLASNFCLRESSFKDYVTFHQLNINEGLLKMYNFDFEAHFFKPFVLSSQKNLDNGVDLQSWQLHNFLSQAYNSLITLTKELKLQVNYGAIHINLIFAAFEKEHLELLKETILKIDTLKKQGDFGEVRIKCFSILSDGDGVSTPNQEENVANTLNTLVEIRKNYDILSHNFILDDKNTQAVSLKVENNYIAFAISEIIVALIRNEYAMLGTLHNEIGVVSIGLGMVYFDVHFFNAFIKNKILESKIELEKIHGRKTNISTSEYKTAVQTSLRPYVENTMEIEAVISNLREALKPENFKNTIRCYEFLLSNLLGKHDRAPLIEPIEADEVYSVNDLIYHNLFNYVLTDKEKEEKGLLELKDFKKKLTEYNAKVRDGIEPSNVKMGEEKQILDDQNNSVQALIKHYANQTWRKNIDLTHNQERIKDQIQALINTQKKEEKEFESKNFFTKLFAKKQYEEHKLNFEHRLQELKNELNLSQSASSKVKTDLDKLYEFKGELEISFKTLDIGINQIHSLKKEYQNEIDGLPYLDYEFIQNIISRKKLQEYEQNHRDELQSNIKNVLNILFVETIKQNKSFSKIIDEKIVQKTDSIIEFKISNYLLSEYDNMNLLEPFNFIADLKKLKQRSFPFFNAIPTYSHHSHNLKCFNYNDEERTVAIENLLEENYTGNLPTSIYSESPNKFALITLEVIEDLKSIVKYNNHYVRSKT